MERAEKILDCLAEKPYTLHINLQNGVRVDRMDERLIAKMRKAGVFKIGFGIETAAPDIQERIRKKNDLRQATHLIKVARSQGIITTAFFMIGLPGETAKTMQETIAFALQMNPHFANISVCVPLPGTELFEEIKRSGKFLGAVENGLPGGFFGGRVLFRLNGTEPQEIISYLRMAYKKFYMRPSKLMDILSTIKSIRELQWLLRIGCYILYAGRSGTS